MKRTKKLKKPKKIRQANKEANLFRQRPQIPIRKHKRSKQK